MKDLAAALLIILPISTGSVVPNSFLTSTSVIFLILTQFLLFFTIINSFFEKFGLFKIIISTN